MQDSLISQSVSIDGLAVRRIREEKRLTQLYVAKVVGVTTDTVSRWENNRYPTIRRDNAVKLADALEVELEAILRRDDPLIMEEPTDASRGAGWRRSLSSLVLLTVVALFLGYGLMTYQRDAQLPPVRAERGVPYFVAPGSQVLFSIRISSSGSLKGIILKEKFPPGWRLLAADPPPAAIDAADQGARWIFRHPLSELTLYYLLQVAPEAEMNSRPTIGGEVISELDGRHHAVPVDTAGVMEVRPLHWVDADGNQVIDDLEILELSGVAEETPLIDAQWDKIEGLWEAGGYVWQPDRQRFVPAPVE